MKIHSDTLTGDDLYAALPADVGILNIRDLKSPRKRSRGWEIQLEGYGSRHTRHHNSGGWGASSDSYAATWDDHGVWMAALYEIDPDAAIAWYTDREDFYEKTEREMRWRRTAKRGSRATAPWLNQVPA